MKKVFGVVLSILLCFTMQIGVFAENAQLRTVVPDSHEITITYNDGGYVLYRGDVVASGDKITIPRFDGILLNIICKSDSHLKAVSINGTDYTAQMLYGQLTLENVDTDLNIVFEFETCADADNPDNPDNPDDPENPDKGDPCIHLTMGGHVYRGTDAFPNAQMEFDLGEFSAQADADGAYSVAEIKDGFHNVVIRDENGEIAGTADFAVAVDETISDVTVTVLSDGTQLVRVPKDATQLRLDFFVNADGSVTLRPEPEAKPPVTDPDDGKDDGKDDGNLITDNPVISQTGALIRENPAAAGAVLLFAVFLLILLLRKRKDREEEQKAV